MTLQLQLENRGQGTARDITAQLFGEFSSDKVNLGTLEGIDAAAGQPGGSRIHEWEKDAPDVPEGKTETREVGVKVTYRYDTRATLPLPLSPDSFVRSQSPVAVSNTAAPVQISSDTAVPIPTGGDEREHSIRITVTNAGDGTIKDGAVVLDPRLVGPPEGVTLDCGGDTISLTVTDSATTTCTLVTPEGVVAVDTAVQVRIDATYTYSREKTTQVRIRGTS